MLLFVSLKLLCIQCWAYLETSLLSGQTFIYCSLISFRWIICKTTLSLHGKWTRIDIDFSSLWSCKFRFWVHGFSLNMRVLYMATHIVHMYVCYIVALVYLYLYEFIRVLWRYEDQVVSLLCFIVYNCPVY